MTPFHSSLFPHLDPPENPGFINSHRGPFTPHTSSPSASPAKGEGCCPGHREHSRCSLLVIGQSSTFGPVEWPHVPPSQCPQCLYGFFLCMSESPDPGPAQGSSSRSVGSISCLSAGVVCGLRAWLRLCLPRRGVYSPNTSRPAWCHPEVECPGCPLRGKKHGCP